MKRLKVLMGWGVGVAFVTIALGACRSVEANTGEANQAVPVGPPGHTGIDGPVLRHLEVFTDEGDDAEIKGVVQIEGDCLYVALDEVGERYPVVWPSSTSWDAETGRVSLPNGNPVAHGDSVYGGGGYHYVDDVAAVAGQLAADLAGECVDNRSGEIAVVNNQSGAIARD